MTVSTDQALGPFLTNEYGDEYLYPVNRDAFKHIDAQNQFRRKLGDIFFREKTLHVVVGTDSGLLLRYLTDKGLPEGSRYLFVELPEVHQRLVAKGFLQNLDDRIACCTPQTYLGQLVKFQVTNYLYTERINIWQSFASSDGFLQEYPDLFWSVRNAIDTIAWRTRLEVGSQIFTRRQLENLAEHRLSVACLKGVFAGKTAVLLAGGPSLDEILPWVRKHRDHLVVLAVSRIARRLQQMDLAPDMFFSVDPHALSFDVSKEMLNFWDRSLFIYKNHTFPPLVSQWRGRSLFVGSRFPWAEKNQEEFLMGPGPTVTNTAFAVAVAMGFSQIVLAGVDLCFSPSGHSHAQGSNESIAGPQFNNFDTQVETNDGSKAFTARAMAEAIPGFAIQAALASQAGCQTINPAPKAARIAHVQFRTLDDIVFEPLHAPASELLNHIIPDDNQKSRLHYYKKVLISLTTAEGKIRTIENLAKEGLKCNNGLFGRNGMKKDFKYKIRMDKVEKALSRSSVAPYSRMVKEYGLRQFIGIARPDTDLEWSDDQIEETGRIYYEAYRDGARLILQLIRMAIERIELRITEEASDADFSELSKTWQILGEPGRVKVWQQRQNLKTHHMPEKTRQELQNLEVQFERAMTAEDSNHLKRSQRDANPELARSKAGMLFKKKDKASLAGLVEGLTSMNLEAAASVRYLTQGYLAELEGDSMGALQAYQQTLDTNVEMVREEALRRVASLSLSLHDSENAFLALQCLSAISPGYLPQYAELAKTMGQIQTALNAYADYLDRFPDDVTVLLKVGRLYKEIGHDDSAASVFRYLLDKDPDNEAARRMLATVAA